MPARPESLWPRAEGRFQSGRVGASRLRMDIAIDLDLERKAAPQLPASQPFRHCAQDRRQMWRSGAVAQHRQDALAACAIECGPADRVVPAPAAGGGRLRAGNNGAVTPVARPAPSGRDDQQADLRTRMRQLQEADPSSAGEAVAEVGGFPPGLSWKHFERAREEAVFALVEEESSEIERLMGDLRRVVTRFDDLSQRAHYASHNRAANRAISHSRRRELATGTRYRGRGGIPGSDRSDRRHGLARHVRFAFKQLPGSGQDVARPALPSR